MEQLLNFRTFSRNRHATRRQVHVPERAMVVETTSSVWKTDALAVVLRPHMLRTFAISTPSGLLLIAT